MSRAKIEDALLAMGIPAGNKGFEYIVDAMWIFEEKGTSISMTKELYPLIAEKNDTTASRAERAIRHAFGVARYKGNNEEVNKYIGTINRSNSSSLKQLHMMLKREETE